MKQLLMGNEAIALGLQEGGLRLATGYPGTPSSEVLSTLAKAAKGNDFYVEWSVNEKVALEVAAGAAYAGARAAVTMKQVGLNVAADPLMTLAYIGVKGGLVLVVADDPGPHSSQNEQDTRKFAQFAKLPVLDPASPEEAREMARTALDISEQLQLPVILRPTTRTCHICQDLEINREMPAVKPAKGFEKSPDWVIFPSLAIKKHRWLNRQQETARTILAGLSFNRLEGTGSLGIITSGVSYNYVREALAMLGETATVLKIGTPYPLPREMTLKFLRQVKRVLVIEEQEPVVEDQVVQLAWQEQLSLPISGKHDRVVPREGEFDVDRVLPLVAAFMGRAVPPAAAVNLPPLPLRTPVLCAGCPHRASFYAFKRAAAGRDAVFTGDIGCYTLGNMPPLAAVDTCLCMGASLTIAAGLQHIEPDRPVVAFLGDSTFFHTGVPGLINAVYNQSRITLVILDNRTTAMTGHQTHPGLGRTAVGDPTVTVDLEQIVRACGVAMVQVVDPYDLAAAEKAAGEALNYNGVAVVIMRQSCVALVQETPAPFTVDPGQCLKCGYCVSELGCPAMSLKDEMPVISEHCTGCGLCARICPAGAIGRDRQ